MGAQQRMVEAKGAILSLLLDAYQKRDRVGMVAFRGEEAEVIPAPHEQRGACPKLLEELAYRGSDPSLCRAYEIV